MRKLFLLSVLFVLLILSTSYAQQVDKKFLKYDEFGNPSFIGGKSRADNPDIDLATKSFLTKNALFKINVNELKEIKRTQVKIKNKDFKVIVYKHEKNGLEVFNSYVVGLMVGNDIVLLRNKYHPNVNVDLNAKIDSQQALDNIKKTGNEFLSLKNPNLTNGFITDGLQAETITLGILPIDKGKKFDYGLAYKIDMPLYDHHKWTFYVDANTGGILTYNDNVEYGVQGHITGSIYPEYFDQSKIEVNFPYEYVTVGLDIVTADLAGNYNSNVGTGSYSLISSLVGPYVKIDNNRLLETSHTTSVVSPSVYDWNWASYDASYKGEEQNVYYHANRIHDYATSIGANMNFQMKSVVNIPATCNAYYSSRSINFYAAGVSCEATSLSSDIIYHEYGHGINDELISISWPYQDQTGNMNEGLADYWACTLNDNPCMGEYFYYSVQCLRRCDTNDVFPADYTPEPHSGAEIISSALWDIRKVLGRQLLDPMVVNALRLQPDSFTELLEDLLIVDDDNQNLLDGTPNVNLICDSFNRHGISSKFCAGFTSSPIAYISYPGFSDIAYEKNAIDITGTAYNSQGVEFKDYALEYSLDNGATWIRFASGNSPVLDGIVGKLQLSNINSGKLSIRLTVNDLSKQKIFSYYFKLDKNIVQNWPKRNSGASIAPIVMADINDDGKSELISSDFTSTDIYTSDGTLMTSLSKGGYTRIPAIGDVNGDGYKDIVILDYTAYLYVYLGNPTHSFPYLTPFYIGFSNIYINAYRISTSPVLADLNGDGKDEIIMAGGSGKVYALKVDNSIISSYNINWPKLLDSTDFTIATPAVGDLNKDGIKEIVVLTKNNKLYVWEPDGNLMPGFPKLLAIGNVNTGVASPAIGDINKDGDLEILVASSNYVYAINHDGTILPGWPIVRSLTNDFRSEVNLADVNNDGYLEIIPNLYQGGRLLYNYNGASMSEYYINWATLTSSVISDYDNDGLMEIIHPGYKDIYLTEKDGSYKYLPTYDYLYSPVTMGNIDADNDLEMAATDVDRTIYLWDIDNKGDGKIEWPMFRRNNRLTGNYHELPYTSYVENKGMPSIAYITLKLQQDITGDGSWQDYSIITNKAQINLLNNQVFDLTQLWKNFVTVPTGSYRAVVELTDKSGNILQSSSGPLTASKIVTYGATFTTTIPGSTTTTTPTTSVGSSSTSISSTTTATTSTVF